MLLFKGNSRWTNANRNHAIHAANNDRLPVCGKKYRNGALDVWEGEFSQVTCWKCYKIIQKKAGGLLYWDNYRSMVEHQKWVEEMREECSCCRDCSDSPCDGLPAGGFCDETCFCGQNNNNEI